jgi:Toxin SymE, type I toxin-antitoxin system
MATEDSTPALPAIPELSISLNPPPAFAPHKMKVSYIGPSTTPYLRLQGHWLEQAGFPVGTPARVEVSERRLIVEAVEPEERPHCAEPNCPHETKKKKKERRPGTGW